MKELIRKILKEETETHDTLCLPYLGADTTPVTGDIGDSRAGGSRTHQGIDLTVKSGTELIAPADGTIETANWVESGGDCGGKIVINHTGTFISPYTGEEVKLKTKYCHLSEVSVEKGGTVTKGQKIGKTGGAASKIDGSRQQKNANGEIVDADNAARTSEEYYREAGAGNSQGNHLHYEVWEDGSYVSPKIYLQGGGKHNYVPCETIAHDIDELDRDDPIALLIWLNQGEVKSKEDTRTPEELIALLPDCSKKDYDDMREDGMAIYNLWQWDYIDVPQRKDLHPFSSTDPANITGLLDYQKKYGLQELPVDIVNGCRIPQETLDHINANEDETIVNEL